MSTQQPDALRLADAMDAVNKNNADSLLVQMAARSASAELRRLHAINAELVEALKACDEAMSYMSEYDIPLTLPSKVKEALAKAEGREA